MNVETLASTLQFLTDLDRNLGLQSKLQAVLSSLENLVQSPADPQYQASLASSLSAFEEAVATLTERISPAVRALIKELEGEKFFDPTIATDVKQAIVTNAMTPSVARDFVRNLSTERETYLGVLNSTNQGVRKLGIKGEQLPTGSAEVAFLILWGIFGNDLGTFAKELGFLNRLITHVSEVLTAHAEPVELGQISSSDPTITLATGLAAMTFIGNAVNKFLDAWKKVEEIREIRQRLNKLGMRNSNVDRIDR